MISLQFEKLFSACNTAQIYDGWSKVSRRPVVHRFADLVVIILAVTYADAQIMEKHGDLADVMA